ncbi:hypothetical protein [Bradyrhizobium sp.]|uniref:hypothetical protein n=1 Tax=Bradyrhizobium sp. TaxID=376 RepID=UPI003C20333E
MEAVGKNLIDLRNRPFRILRVEPTGKLDSPEVQQGSQIGSNIVNFEREVLRDPTRRLLCELSCPMDCPPREREAVYAALSNEAASTDELLLFADRLWPLTRANFIAQIVSRQPANAALLYALLESHAAIDASVIYEKLMAARTAAGIPGPSWISVRQGLDDLLDIHCAAVFAGYCTAVGSIEPVLGCTQQVLAHGERNLVEVLGSLLRPYRRCVDQLQKDAIEQVSHTCAEVLQKPDDALLIEELVSAMQAWMSTSRPLLMRSVYYGGRDLDFDTPTDQLRTLIAGLFEKQHYEAASQIADLSSDIFRAVPTTIDELAEDARLIEDLSFHCEIAKLRDTINELEGNPDPLIAVLERDGFGSLSTDPAKRLWTNFLRVTETTNQQARDAAWPLLRDFALRLSNRPEAARAVAHLIGGLIEYGESVSVAPALLNALRNDLNFMKSFIEIEPAKTDIGAGQTPRRELLLSASFGRRLLRISLEKIGLTRHRIVWTISALLVTVLCGSATYLEFDQLHLFWSTLLRAAPALTSSGETMPPIGSGQHLTLDGVRYCRFQQERLRFVKQQVQDPEDARAYNLLIVDYNSRCSDFFYEDNDLKTVLAELDAKRQLLETEAKQIVSNWPKHAARVAN